MLSVFAPPTSAQVGLILQNEPNLAAKNGRNDPNRIPPVTFRQATPLETVMTAG
jgi:hypothetical protein